ncbi:J domain-containing protein [Treponema pedis]|uniref:DnaJ protein n=1 Tax=Treponema pedis str. T A4 TaxID=1291379 RepID=S6A888_9SPIR|nr:J domain-containing protein [Treponema pedis]AGT43404.1 DnaJ protein [Treponema pedis str. T A4]QSI04215.1 J domain-containing protein [Treponema pedis]
MSGNYYDEMGSILRDALTSDEDPFEAALRPKGKYRKTASRMERRPPPKINTEKKRIPVPPELIEDFAVLNVLPGVPLEDCKKAWKHLIKKHHPDIAQKTDNKFDTNEIICRINNAYRKIEVWFTTGKILTEKELNS